MLEEEEITEARDEAQERIAEAAEASVGEGVTGYIDEARVEDDRVLLTAETPNGRYSQSFELVDTSSADGKSEIARRIEERLDIDLRYPDELVGADVLVVQTGLDGECEFVFETELEGRIRRLGMYRCGEDGIEGLDSVFLAVFGGAAFVLLLGIVAAALFLPTLGLALGVAAFVLFLGAVVLEFLYSDVVVLEE